MAFSKEERARLFPVAHFFGSVIASTTHNEDRPILTKCHFSQNATFAESTPNKGDFFTYSVAQRPLPLAFTWEKTVELANDSLYILPNGYFFQRVQLGNKESPTWTVSISNELYNDSMHAHVDSFIDTSHAAILSDSAKKHELCGMNVDRTALYSYVLKPSRGTVYETMFHLSHACDSYDLDKPYRRKKNAEQLYGTPIFKSTDKKIRSFSGFPALNANTLAIVFEDGEIVYGHVNKKGRFVDQVSLQAPIDKANEFEYHSSPFGFLIGHSATNGVLRIWDLNQSPAKVVDHKVPALSKLRVSANGHHLTALAVDESGETKTAHCFRLKHFKHHTIQLQTPVTDFIIGYQNQVDCLTKKHHGKRKKKDSLKRESLGPLEELLRSPAATEKPSPDNYFAMFKRARANSDSKLAKAPELR